MCIETGVNLMHGTADDWRLCMDLTVLIKQQLLINFMIEDNKKYNSWESLKSHNYF